MNVKVGLATLGVLVGCCVNMAILEFMITLDPGSGNLITFAQFVCTALDGFVFTSKFGTEPLQIPIQSYLALVAMHFALSVSTNYAYDFNIPVPLHIIFRSGSLTANMVMGMIILKRRYEFSKYLSVLMITAGIAICTIISGSSVKSTVNPDVVKEEASGYSAFFWWLCGIALLTFSLLLSARMGIYQEVLYKQHGKHPREALFVTHLLPLPGFLLMFSNIAEHVAIANASEPVSVPLIGASMPILWIFLIANCLTQYLCVNSVFILTTECSSLACTLVFTLRKFISLLFSIVYFQNPFTIHHWIGTALVFLGTMIFTEILPLSAKKPNAASKAKKEN